jgi:hypothetical protein
MAIHHLTVTLSSAAAQAISTPAAGTPSINCKEIQIQGESGGAAAFIGGSTVSATDYGQTIAATSLTPVIIRPDGMTTINLASTYIIGTSGNKFHVLYTQ